MNETVQLVLLCVWLLSLSIVFVKFKPKVAVAHSFSLLYGTPLQLLMKKK